MSSSSRNSRRHFTVGANLFACSSLPLASAVATNNKYSNDDEEYCNKLLPPLLHPNHHQLNQKRQLQLNAKKSPPPSGAAVVVVQRQHQQVAGCFFSSREQEEAENLQLMMARENDQFLATAMSSCDCHINRAEGRGEENSTKLSTSNSSTRTRITSKTNATTNTNIVCSWRERIRRRHHHLAQHLTNFQLKLFAVTLIHLILLIQNEPNHSQHHIRRGQVQADIFSSTSHLQNLMYLERHLIMSLGQYVVNMEQKLTKIRHYIDHWEATAGRDEFVGTYSEEEIIGNPLQAFQLVKRLTIDWKTISELFKQDQWNDVQQLTQDYKAIMPSDDDLHGAALAIVRLQDTYNLTERELAMGKIKEHSTRIQMTARDCLYLAKHAFNNAYYGHSLDWFEEALRRAYGEGNTTASVSEIQPFYQMASQVVEQFRAENKGTSLDTYHIYMEASGSKEHSTKFKMLEDDNEDYRKYQALCRNEKRRTPAEEAPLKCYLRHNNHPLLYLSPIKLEVQNVKPFISIIHNLMTEKEADTIRELAAPMLTRARVQTDNGTADMVSKTRTSQTAWFSPDTHPIVSRMTRRIEAATGLSADMTDSHCELMQVANYGMGGHYTPHYDYLIVDRPEEERDQVDDRELYAGDRTATVMFYLKDVVRGGATVFPRLGVHLKPEIGAAAFWYNLYKNGEGIIETVHGACPVLMGEKWVANFWIRERGQFSKRPCTLNPKE